MRKIKTVFKMMLCMLILLGGMFVDSSMATANTQTTTQIKKEGLELDKTATVNSDGSYTISLEAYTTGNVQTELKSKPVDFILVMDQSGSMNRNIAGYPAQPGELTRQQILKDAAQKFIDKTYKDAVENDADHRMSIVTFGDRYRGSGIASGYKDKGATYPGGYSGDDRYKDQLLRINDAKNYSNLKKSITDLSADDMAETHPDLGVELANRIYDADTTEKERSKVIILLTDGEPSLGRDEATVSEIKKSKDAGVDVFTISGFMGTGSGAAEVEKFLNYVSSNYPDAVSMKNPGTKKSSDYTYSANNSDELNRVFETIYEQIVTPSIVLKEDTILKDIMSEYFKTPSVSDVKVSTLEYVGKDSAGKDMWFTEKKDITNEVIIEIVDNQIIVTGYDYSQQIVGIDKVTGKAIGEKLVVEFKTVAIDGFIGGNVVPTNDIESGIYTKDGVLATFPEPKVEVSVKFTPTSKDESIYIGSMSTQLDSMFDASNDAGLQYKQGDKIYTFDGINNAFVDIFYTVTDSKGNTIGTYKIPAGKTIGVWIQELNFGQLNENTQVTIKTDIFYINSNKVELTGDQSSNIFVFTPKILVNDQDIFLGEDANLANSIGSVSWHNVVDTAPPPSGNAPILDYQYLDSLSDELIQSYKFNNDTYLDLKVLNNERDITSYTNIVSQNQHKNGDFMLQVVKGELKIEKTIDKQYTTQINQNASQSFIFKVERRDEMNGAVIETFYQTIEFSANEKIKTKELKLIGLTKGYYTITEDSNWSWKYSEKVSQRLDNYNGNGIVSGSHEATHIYIGDKTSHNTNGFKYYGSESTTSIAGVKQGNPAQVLFVNVFKSSNIVGDNATAKNIFTKK